MITIMIQFDPSQYFIKFYFKKNILLNLSFYKIQTIH